MLRTRSIALTLVLLASTASLALAQAPAAVAAAQPFVVEYYYKTKWGTFDEFKTLFKKNHYPVLMKEQGLGRIVRVTVDSLRNSVLYQLRPSGKSSHQPSR